MVARSLLRDGLTTVAWASQELERVGFGTDLNSLIFTFAGLKYDECHCMSFDVLVRWVEVTNDSGADRRREKKWDPQVP